MNKSRVNYWQSNARRVNNWKANKRNMGTPAWKYFAATAALIALAGCMNLAPKYERPAQDLPADWGAAGTPVAHGDAWWRVFGEAQLDRLVDEALAHNANLALAVGRIDEARAQLGLARAEQFPAVSAGLQRNRTQRSERTSIPFPPGTPLLVDTHRATLDTAYELDLWGRLRNARRAAQAELLASEAAAQTVRMTLAADVTQAYFAMQALDGQIAATARTLAARSEALALQKLRYEVGALSAFEYRQLEAETLAARAQLPSLEQRRVREETALAVLLGRSPRAIFAASANALAEAPAADVLPADAVKAKSEGESGVKDKVTSAAASSQATPAPAETADATAATPVSPAPVKSPQAQTAPADAEPSMQAPDLVVPAELPSELLLRRPDLIVAEQRLIAANARIGVARAAYFPAISLTGMFGSESAVLRDLFTGPATIWQAAGTLTQPIWGAGRVSSLTATAHARQRQMLASYRNAIQTAFRDVRNAIVAQTKSREQLDVERQRVTALQEALRLARLRYENGIASQLDVLDTERALLAAELSRHEALRAQRAAIADLFKALGGAF